jgi:hypothetical protein
MESPVARPTAGGAWAAGGVAVRGVQFLAPRSRLCRVPVRWRVAGGASVSSLSCIPGVGIRGRERRPGAPRRSRTCVAPAARVALPRKTSLGTNSKVHDRPWSFRKLSGGFSGVTTTRMPMRPEEWDSLRAGSPDRRRRPSFLYFAREKSPCSARGCVLPLARSVGAAPPADFAPCLPPQPQPLIGPRGVADLMKEDPGLRPGWTHSRAGACAASLREIFEPPQSHPQPEDFS